MVQAEAEEHRGVRDIPKFANAATRPPLGPSVRVGLRQDGVTSSAEFDWDYLLSVWAPHARRRADDWVPASPRPKGHDKANWQAMLAKGGPKYLGIGFGEAQTRISRSCMFGARFQLAPSITLGELVTTWRRPAELLLQMALVQPPK